MPTANQEFENQPSKAFLALPSPSVLTKKRNDQDVFRFLSLDRYCAYGIISAQQKRNAALDCHLMRPTRVLKTVNPFPFPQGVIVILIFVSGAGCLVQGQQVPELASAHCFSHLSRSRHWYDH
jgi:hypothetical protein